MWKHALLYNNETTQMPETQAHEAHIVKTAQRVEELNAWVSQDLDPWEFLKPVLWYFPTAKELSEGIAVYLKHTLLPTDEVYSSLKAHVHDYETLSKKDGYLYFRRC